MSPSFVPDVACAVAGREPTPVGVILTPRRAITGHGNHGEDRPTGHIRAFARRCGAEGVAR